MSQYQNSFKTILKTKKGQRKKCKRINRLHLNWVRFFVANHKYKSWSNYNHHTQLNKVSS